MPTIEQIITAEFDFAAIKELYFKLYTHPNVDGVLVHFRNFVESLSPFVWAAILAAIAVAFTFFGKKLLCLPIILGSFAIGFAGGAAYIGPRLANLVEQYVSIDPTVVGIVIGSVFALLCILVYFGFLALGVGYSVYLCVYPFFNLLLGAGTAPVASLAVGAAVVIAVFIFRKWFEMAATSVLGGFIMMHAVNAVVLLPLPVNIAIWAVFAVAGTVVQIKTRRKY